MTPMQKSFSVDDDWWEHMTKVQVMLSFIIWRYVICIWSDNSLFSIVKPLANLTLWEFQRHYPKMFWHVEACFFILKRMVSYSLQTQMLIIVTVLTVQNYYIRSSKGLFVWEVLQRQHNSYCQVKESITVFMANLGEEKNEVIFGVAISR